MVTNLPFVWMLFRIPGCAFPYFSLFQTRNGWLWKRLKPWRPLDRLEDLTGLESSLALVISQKSFEHVQVRACSVDPVRTFPNVFPQPGDGNRMNQGWKRENQQKTRFLWVLRFWTCAVASCCFAFASSGGKWQQIFGVLQLLCLARALLRRRTERHWEIRRNPNWWDVHRFTSCKQGLQCMQWPRYIMTCREMFR